MRKKKQQRSVIPKERKSRPSKRKERKRLAADGGSGALEHSRIVMATSGNRRLSR